MSIQLSQLSDLEKVAWQIEPHVGDARFSSSIRPVRFETDQGKYIRYEMTFFAPPENRSQLNIHIDAKQFKR